MAHTTEAAPQAPSESAEAGGKQDEARDVARLIEHKLAYSVSPDDDEALDELDIQRAYLKHRFIQPIRLFERTERFYGYLDTFLNFASILCGIGISLSAALNASKV